MNSICIANQPLGIKVWDSQRVVTFNDVDRVHQRPKGTASRNFRENREHFIEGVDYYDLTTAKFQSDEIRRTGFFNNPRGGFLLTEMGYLMLVKSFTDDLAWQVQRSLVQNYFRGKEETQSTSKTNHQEVEKVYKKPVRKFFGGRPVMTIKDLEYLIDCSKEMVFYYLRLHDIMGVKLEGKHLRDFKCENGQTNTTNSLLIFEKAHVEWLLRQLKQFEERKAFFNEYFALDYNSNLSKEEMCVAVKQASLLLDTAREIKDFHAKEQTLKAVTAILINIGLWNDRHHGYNGVTSEWSINSTEGWNKRAVMLDAKRLYLG